MIDFEKEAPENIIQANTDGGKFIPINDLEDLLDPLEWSTRNFNYHIFKNGYADLVIAASLELVITIRETTGVERQRSFVGACSFSLNSIAPNSHFLATAKSECVKNAASDIGRYFGRHLNDDFVPAQNNAPPTERPKAKPDSKIMRQFMDAAANGDQATVTMLSNIYDIKTEQNEKGIRNDS